MNESLAKEQLHKLVNLTGLSKEEARVEIARDVLAALQLKKLRVKTMSYVQVILPARHKVHADLRDYLAESTCEVCAIGAAFIAVVARDNAFGADEPDADNRIRVGNHRQLLNRLAAFFSETELGLMEAFFERNLLSPFSSSAYSSFVGQSRKQACAWRRAGKGLTAHQRLTCFYEALISSKGVFPVVEQLYQSGADLLKRKAK